MKTSEFIEKVEKLEFVSAVIKSEFFLDVHSKSGLLCRVDRNNYFASDNCYGSFINLDDSKKNELMNIVFSYIKTPLTYRDNKKIEEKTKEYIQECINEAHDFYSCVDNLTYNAERQEGTRENEIYVYYLCHSNEFVKMWCEVAADE